MIVTQAKRIVDNLIDVQCYQLNRDEYGTEQKYWFYSDQCCSKEQAIKNIDNWVNNIITYSQILKLQIKELDK